MVVERKSTGGNATSNFTAMKFGYLVSGDAIAKGPLAALGLEAKARKSDCKPAEEVLRRQVVRLARELLEHAQPLPRHAQAGRGDALVELCRRRLTCLGHATYPSR